ncbi:hypothetical protein SUDANB105_03297 [Streptomyces sp. enrichment culture]|uniref:hypothetical protein n=1 Tax=Streptomyces sp. enrichment culture TaxID=1795815 RepID=UPI003F54A4AF
MLPPSAIAGVSFVCALGPWVFTEPMVLRGLAAAAAVTAAVGAVVMRRWDTQAGKRVADLTRARASDEWRFEERVAELEADLDESRELRRKLEQRLRAKRTELAGLRNEHAALLRRYATAETERASALENRRLLELEAAVPARALPPVPVRESEPERAETAEQAAEAAEEKPGVPALFSPEGSRLFARAGAALARLDADADVAAEDKAKDAPKGVAEDTAKDAAKGVAEDTAKDAAKADSASDSGTKTDPATASDRSGASVPRQAAAPDAARPTETEAAPEDEAQGKPEAAAGQEHAAAASTDPAAEPPAGQQPAGHFTVPTAVAVVPAAPARRPAIEGGFDFFGTKDKAAGSAALEAVQNEDLADVVGREALDEHRTEAGDASEDGSEPAAAAAAEPAVGHVIDLTAHDETEQIDLQGLRSAAS